MNTLIQLSFRFVKGSVASSFISRCFHVTPAQGRLSGREILEKIGVDPDKYTTKPLPFFKMGGRNEYGRIENHREGGGHKKLFRMVDFKRPGPKDSAVEERVVYVRYDPCRTANIALVSGREHKRYILASENMKAGDIIKSTSHIPRIAVRPKDGDAHPLGALPLGTLVHNVERLPNEGGKVARAAGTCATVVRKIGDQVVVRMPSKRELCVNQECMATVGRVSNVEHGKQPIGSANRSRWLGIRPHSGWWHRKTGYNGRKIRPIKPMKVFSRPELPKANVYRSAP